MKINIIHKKREPNYLEQTLDSLEKSDWRHTDIPITVFYGSDEETQIRMGNFEAVSTVSWIGGDYGIRHNVNINYERALRYFDDDVIILEDDVLFGRNWMSKLFLCIEELETYKNKKNYIISLYKSGKDGGLWFSEYDGNFWGSQGVYYPQIVIDSIRNGIIMGMDDHFADLLIGGTCRREKIEIFTPKKSVIQHNGVISVSNCDFHTSNDWEE